MYTRCVYNTVATEVVQFREDTAELEFLRKQGVNPNEFARRAFEEAMRFARASARMTEIRRVRKALFLGAKLPPRIDIVALVRDDRDSDHGRK
ncbi:MAG TPA: hypothetical protein VGA56_23620 [Opitutaceae bacterium]